MPDSTSVLDELQPVEQVALGNCARIGMYALGTQGPGMLVATRDDAGIIIETQYVPRTTSRRAFGRSFPGMQTDWYAVVQQYDPTAERLVYLQHAATGLGAMIRLPFAPMERPTALMMQLVYAHKSLPLAPVDAIFSRAAQRPYDPAASQQQPDAPPATIRPPQLPPPVPADLRYPPAYRTLCPHIALLYLSAINAGLRSWYHTAFQQAGRGVCVAWLEAGCFLPLFVEEVTYLTAAQFQHVSDQTGTEETAATDREVLEMIATYDPDHEGVLMVYKPDADPNRMIAVMKPADGLTDEEVQQAARDLLQQARVPRGNRRS